MSKSQADEAQDGEVRLVLIAGTSDAENNNSCNHVTDQRAACCNDPYHRKLAICSIICGLSCIGVTALIDSVRAEEVRDPTKAAMFTQRARKRSIISIVTWVAILVSVPLLMGLISYLLTLID